MPKPAFRRSLRSVVALVVGGLFVAQLAQSETTPRRTYSVPERHDSGSFEGTWYYISRDYRFVFWIRNVDGVPQVQVRAMNLSTLEGFTTGWDGKAEYQVANFPAQFELSIEKADENTLRGSWYWDLDLTHSRRKDTGKVEIFRAGFGRVLVLHFTELEKHVLKRGRERSHSLPQVWSFRKASNRLVRWEEIPF